MKNRISLYLILTLLIMSLIPLLGAYAFIEDILTSQAAIYKSPSINRALENAQAQLKRLAKLDSENEAEYKEQFQTIEDLKLIYGEDALFNLTLKATFQKYFFIGFGICLAASLCIGLVLSRLIDRSFRKLFQTFEDEKEKSRYLKNVAGWQEIAKTLAHEIKRPLMPITVWLSNLGSLATKVQNQEMKAQIEEASMAIGEEMVHLKQMVDNFSNFGRLPEPRIETVDLKALVERLVESHRDLWPQARFVLDFGEAQTLPCQVDAAMMKQIVGNLVDNAIEANAQGPIEVRVTGRSVAGRAELTIFNSGREIDRSEAEKIFEPYYSTKKTAENLGLGLAIVKMQVLKQGGEIANVEAHGGAMFRMSLRVT